MVAAVEGLWRQLPQHRDEHGLANAQGLRDAAVGGRGDVPAARVWLGQPAGWRGGYRTHR